jgi:hypothetical protein
MPRDCTDPLLPQLNIDVQSPLHRVSHTMPNKNKNKRVVAVKQQKSKNKQKPTPFSDAGAIVGSKLGTMFNAPYLKGVGKWLGSGIGQIFGSGDYQIMGAMPDYNVLMNGAQIPKFSSLGQTNIVCHREYIGDYLGTASFNNNIFPLNPGVATTFPWLSSLAQNYQEYKFHGLIFEFRPLITDFIPNGAPGVVVMATNYNADAPSYTTKQQMENSEFAVSVKPTRELMHGVECNGGQTVLPQLYVRTGAVPAGQDLRLYDLGNFQFATQNNPVQNLGELWVSYCVEFYKPILPTDVGGNIRSSFVTRTTFTNASPLGNIQISNKGDLGVIMDSLNVSWQALPGTYYSVVVDWNGAVAAAITYPTRTYFGISQVGIFGGGTDFFVPAAGVSSTRACHQAVFLCTLASPGTVSFTSSTTGTLPTGTNTCYISVNQFSAEAVG